MKKKILRIIAITIIVFIIIAVGLILIPEKFQKIKFINEIKQAITTKETNLEQENDVTIIDITGIEMGKEEQHEHVYKTVFNESKHWEQCNVCGEKQKEESHNYIDSGWLAGTPDICSETNLHIFTCECGSKISDSDGRAEHYYHAWTNDPYDYIYSNWCIYCPAGSIDHKCKVGNRRITCKNLGQCTICGYNYTRWRTFI